MNEEEINEQLREEYGYLGKESILLEIYEEIINEPQIYTLWVNIKTKLEEHLDKSIILIRGVGKNNTGGIDLFGKGLYLTDDVDVAKFYGETIKSYKIPNNIFDTTKPFTPTILKKFYKSLDKVLNTHLGTKFFNDIVDMEDGEIPNHLDYIQISWALNSEREFYNLLKDRGLNTNQFNSYANDCTAMNMALKDMGYVGLKYSTNEIEDLEEAGLTNRNAYVIFNLSVIEEIH